MRLRFARADQGKAPEHVDYGWMINYGLCMKSCTTFKFINMEFSAIVESLLVVTLLNITNKACGQGPAIFGEKNSALVGVYWNHG